MQIKTPTLILDGLNDLLSDKGFKLIKSRNEFVRKTPSGFHSVSLSGFDPSRGQTATRLPKFKGHITLGIRYDGVEDGLLPLGLIVGRKNQKNVTSASRTVNEHYPFKRMRDKAIVISHKNSHRDEEKAVRKISKMLLKDGLNWFDRHSALAAYEKEVNSPPYWKATNIYNNPEGRAYRGIMSAAVCKGSDYAKSVADNYLNAMNLEARLSESISDKVERNIKTLLDTL